MGRSSKEIADELLGEAGVACLDGGGFGEYGKGYVRFSYANSYENLMRAAGADSGLGETLKRTQEKGPLDERR